MESSKQTKEFLKSKKGSPLDKDSPPGVARKHKLQNTWTLWRVDHDPKKSWEDILYEVGSFNTVEDFWIQYYSTDPPSKLKIDCDYMLFKKGIRPMWEDLPNKHGGRWTYIVHKEAKSELDTIWLDVLLCLIGEACDHCDQICGALVRIRKSISKVSVWTKNCEDNEANMEIGQKLCELVSVSSKKIITFKSHRQLKPQLKRTPPIFVLKAEP
ncbi:eukaryotic translation initiation factor 4E1 [Drosophila yakuba]|uniref:eIF-4F 25 kDa subunit n=1 Tax=Drosophila yakuba TaxID=7245 RepID=B4PQM1_DROYA|nr:eukaryotic translation initiation factor 4E1 [Drosophila yakuba]EDW98360.1 uncharacterized protein Dyak_GE10483 [Drosophila yakuba]